MARTIKVTRTQVAAAKVLVKNAARSGKPVDPAVEAIANAKRRTPSDDAPEPSSSAPSR